MKRISDGLFKNRTRKPRKARGKAAIQDDDELNKTEFDNSVSFNSNPAVPDESSGQVHLDQDDMRWSVAPCKVLYDEDDEDLCMTGRDNDLSVRPGDMYTSVRGDELEVEDTKPSAPKTTETPSKKKKKLKKKIKDLPFGSPLGKKKKKKKSLSEESSKGKKKGKKKKAKDTVSTEESTELGDTPESNEAPILGDVPRRSAPKKSNRSSFFKNSLYNSISPTAVLNIFNQEPSKPDDNPTSPEPKEVDGSNKSRDIMSEANDFSAAIDTIDEEDEDSTFAEKRQEKVTKQYKLKDAVSKVRGFGVFRDQISEHRKFMAAFDDDKEENEDATVTKKREQQKEHFNKLIDELQECEAMLQKEQAEMSLLKATIRLEQNSMEELLHQESLKNGELQAENEALREQLDHAGEAAHLDELREEIRMLKTENELLQQKTERQQETISSMMVAEKSTSISRTKFPPSQASSLVLSEEGSMKFTNLNIDDEDDSEWGQKSGFTSMSNLSGKAQGELLQLRSTLKSKNKTLEEQARELAEVKQELDELKEEQGLEKLNNHVENLENEKKYFVSEIERLKEELNEAKTSAHTTSKQEDTETEGSGWFGFGAKKKTIDKVEEDDFKDVVNDLNGTIMAASISGTTPLEQSAGRLSTLMDF